MELIPAVAASEQFPAEGAAPCACTEDTAHMVAQMELWCGFLPQAVSFQLEQVMV